MEESDRYHVVVVRGRETVAYMTGSPLNYKEATTFLRKCGTHVDPACQYVLVRSRGFR